MDFSRFQHLGADFMTSNTSTTSLPSSFLETFIPGYGVLSQILLRLLGIDIGLVVSGCVVVLGLSHAVSFFNSYVYSYFDLYFTSSIYMDGNDELYRETIDWVTQQRMTRISRNLRAHTKQRNNHGDSDHESEHDNDASSPNAIFNYGKWASNVPPHYEPNYGTDKFIHAGRTFTLSRDRKETKQAWAWDRYDESLTIRCIGRSTQPIKDLLSHIKKWTLRNEKRTTSIYRPKPKNESGGDTEWDRQSNRASRPMRTVSLGREEKRLIVNDINEYLQPQTKRWYDARGIPYRRGYLFHGPPGTGKTSLSFALAGVFGLHIYCISLSEIGLTEADLNKLFSELPQRCIVLLEDIDSAGLRRDAKAVPSNPTAPSTSAITKPPAGEPSGPRQSLISLSGLLNVIDGVASHEGRVLVMSTNHPENLDDALTRPGRVDVRIGFSLATHTQIRDIFIRMYGTEIDTSRATDAEKIQPIPKPKYQPNENLVESEDEDDIDHLLFDKPVIQTLDKHRLKTMAQEFADKLPEGKFSPAAIQGYLLTRKGDPGRALEEACEWRDQQLEALEKKV